MTISTRILSRAVAAATLVFACAGTAQTAAREPIRADDFAWQWSLKLPPEQDVVTITLTPAIYARLQRDDLRDLAAFNADGESLPFGPSLPLNSHVMGASAPKTEVVPIFRVPRSLPDESERLSLNLTRDGSGRLRQLNADIGTRNEAARVDDWLLDLSALEAPVGGLRIELDDAALGTLNARIQISASRDLDAWSIIAPSQTLLSLHRGKMNLERLSLEFPVDEWLYMRLRRIDEESTLPLTEVSAEMVLPATMIDQRLTMAISGSVAIDQPGTFNYRLEGPYPVERVGVELADRNTLAIVMLESRADPSQPWRERASGTAFRLGGNTGDIHAAPFELGQTRDRFWRVRSEPALSRAPMLNVGYRQEEFVLLAQGAEPYRIVAGSTTALRPVYPLHAVLPKLGVPSALGKLPAPINVGVGQPLADGSAFALDKLPLGKWLLWTILIVASATITLLALRLLRESKRGS